MHDRKYKRVRDALLDIFASMALEHSCTLIRKQRVTAGNSQFRGRLKNQPLLTGDLIARNHTCTVVVNVGRQDGAASILRCWHDLVRIQTDHRPHVVLFYVAIVKATRGAGNPPPLWKFVHERAKSDLGPVFEAYYGECTRPPLDPHEDIPVVVIHSCQIQLHEQGLWEKFTYLLGGERPGAMNQLSSSQPGSEIVGKISSRT